MSRQQSVLRNTVGSCHLATSTELYRLCIFTPKRAAGRKPWGKLSPAASHDLLCQLWKAALWDRIRATPLVGVQPTDRQLHHLLQRHAPLQAARAQGEPGRHARAERIGYYYIHNERLIW